MMDLRKDKMAGRITIAELANLAEVSVSTVDRMLNGRHPVRRATAEKVLAAAEASGFYATRLLKERLGVGRPKVKLGFLLQQSNRTFYRLIADAIRLAAEDASPPAQIHIEHMDDLSPEHIAGRMLAMGGLVDALAVVSAEHPRITHAVETLAADGVTTFGLISALTAACGTGYVGLDNWKVGRTAAWALAGLCHRPGRIGILVGNHRYRCQEMNESGFRSYFREHAPDFTLLEPVSTFEDKAIARDVTETLLQREPDLVGLYIAGGGITGAMAAMADAGRAKGLVTVGHDLTSHTRGGLMDGLLTMVLAHPVSRLASEAVAAMTEAAQGKGPPGQRLLGFDIFTSENI